MANELFDLMGVDSDEPRVKRALQDVKDVERIIDTLVALRRDLGVSQQDIAGEMGTTQSAVSKLERAGSDPRISTLQRYAAAVGARVRFGLETSTGRRAVRQASDESAPSGGSDDGESEGAADIVVRRAS